MTNSIREIIARMPNVQTLTLMQYEVLMKFRRDKERIGICTNIQSQDMLISECRYIDNVLESKYNLLSDLPDALKEKVMEKRNVIDVNLNKLNVDDIKIILDSIPVFKPGTIVKINEELGVLLSVEPYLHGYGYVLASPINRGTVIKYLKDAYVIKQSITYDDIKTDFNLDFIADHNLNALCSIDAYAGAIVYEPVTMHQHMHHFYDSLYPSVFMSPNETSDE